MNFILVLIISSQLSAHRCNGLSKTGKMSVTISKYLSFVLFSSFQCLVQSEMKNIILCKYSHQNCQATKDIVTVLLNEFKASLFF